MSDWFEALGLSGSESVISAFVTSMLGAHPAMRHGLLERASRPDRPLSADAAEQAGWTAAREWFIAGTGNVDILLRNRDLRLTFLIEHKVATRLSKGQLAKYLDGLRLHREREVVVPCLLVPRGEAHPVDRAHDGTVDEAVMLDYGSFIESAAGLAPPWGSGDVERAIHERCLAEMRRLSTPAKKQPATTPERDARRSKILDRIERGLPGAERAGLEVRLSDGTCVRVPAGRRDCISIVRSGGQRTRVPWPEPGLDAPWWYEDEHLLEEQADIVFVMLRTNGAEAPG